MTFQHRRLYSLHSIRFLNLHPSSDLSSPLDISLLEVSLDDFPSDRHSYEALSYVWGVRKGSVPCTCDGKELLITPNWDDALQSPAVAKSAQNSLGRRHLRISWSTPNETLRKLEIWTLLCEGFRLEHIVKLEKRRPVNYSRKVSLIVPYRV